MATRILRGAVTVKSGQLSYDDRTAELQPTLDSSLAMLMVIRAGCTAKREAKAVGVLKKIGYRDMSWRIGGTPHPACSSPRCSIHRARLNFNAELNEAIADLGHVTLPSEAL
jgi:hypothetical protein